MSLSVPPQDDRAAFYVTGGTLPVDATSYVKRQADETLFAALADGELCYVLNARQMGKSSLMVRTAKRLKQAGQHCVILDLTAVGQNLSPEQWYDGLLALLAEQLHLEDELEDFWLANKSLGAMQRFFAAVRQIALPALEAASPASHEEAKSNSRLVLFVDEIDAVRSLPFSADEFFAGIRQCLIARATDPALLHLTFCLLGTATPADLIQDTRITPFNVGRRIELKDFSSAEASPLAAGLDGKGQGKKLLDRVLYWTNGHPYLTQRLCAAALEQQKPSVADIDRLCKELFLSHKARETDDNLMLVRNRLLKSETDLAALLDLYRQVRSGKSVKDDETNVLGDVLKLSGVVREENGLLKVRNRIYAAVFDKDWITKHLPDAELRRQKAAYRRGILRASLLLGSVGLVVSVLAIYAFQQAGVARRASANTRLEAARAQEALKAEQTALKAQEEASKAREEALKHAQEALIHAEKETARANTEAENARKARVQEVEQHRQADFERKQAVAQSHLAGERGEKARAALVRLDLANGQRLTEEGDYTQAMLWYAEALRLEKPDPAEQEKHRLRLTALMERLPRLKNVWFVSPQKNLQIAEAQISPDSRFVATTLSYPDRVEVRALPTQNLLLTLPGVRMLAFSPDGNRLVVRRSGSGEKSRQVQIWDIAARKAVTSWLLHALPTPATFDWAMAGIQEAAFSPDGARLVTLYARSRHDPDDATIQIWDSTTGKSLLGPLPHRGNVASASFSPHGSQFARIEPIQVSSAAARIWSVDTGKPLTPLMGRDFIMNALFSPDGQRLLTYPREGYSGLSGVRMWDAATGAPLISPIPLRETVRFAAFAPGGRLFALATQSEGADSSVKVFSVETGNLAADLRQKSKVNHFVFLPEGRQIIAGSGSRTGEGEVRFWDISSAAPFAPPVRLRSPASSVILSQDGTSLYAVGREDSQRANEIRRWELPKMRQSAAWWVRSEPLLFSRSTDLVLLVRQEWTVQENRAYTFLDIKNTRTGKPVYTPLKIEGSILAADLHPDGRRVVVSVQPREGGIGKSPPGSFQIWDFRTGRRLLYCESVIGAGAVRFSPKGDFFTAVANGKTAFINSATGKLLVPVSPEKTTWMGTYPTGLAFTPDGKKLLAANILAFTLWDVISGKKLVSRQLETSGGTIGSPVKPGMVAIRADGLQSVFSAGGHAAYLCRLTAPYPVITLPHTDFVDYVAFSPDGKRVATASHDKTARIWDGRTGKALTPPMNHSDPVLQVEFHPDGRSLATVTKNEVRLWDVRTGEPLTPPLLPDIPQFRFAFSPQGEMIAAGQSSIERRFPKAEKRTPAEWGRMARLLAARQLDSTGGVTPAEVSTLEQDWQQFASHIADAKQSSQRQAKRPATLRASR